MLLVLQFSIWPSHCTFATWVSRYRLAVKGTLSPLLIAHCLVHFSIDHENIEENPKLTAFCTIHNPTFVMVSASHFVHVWSLVHVLKDDKMTLRSFSPFFRSTFRTNIGIILADIRLSSQPDLWVFWLSVLYMKQLKYSTLHVWPRITTKVQHEGPCREYTLEQRDSNVVYHT